GTQQRTQVAIWEADGITEVSCNRYTNNGDDVVVGATSLTPGLTYYISVDVQNGGYYGTFTLCLSDALDYDYHEGAFEITDTNNWCSADAAFTTIGGTSDKNRASCWNTNGGVTLYNRWFKFTAPASGFINVTVDVGGSKGTQQRTQVAIWEADGTTEVSCNRYTSNGDDVTVGAISLTPGSTYYISVDVQNGGYYGTFTLCVDDEPGYDFYEGALEITDLNNWCSSDAEFTTIGGTSDKNKASCWNTNGGVTLYNRWFKFVAISTVATITVDIGGSKGTQQRTQLALWQAEGTTEVACQRYIANGDDVTIVAPGLTPGNTYYISVDVQNGGYYGTFTLCVNNVNNTYYSFADGNWNSPGSWSATGHGGPAETIFFPVAGDVANIEGHTITVGANADVAEIDLNVATANTGLIVSNAALNVSGKITLINSGNNFTGSITIQNNGTAYINDNLVLTRAGGNQSFGVTVASGLLTVNKDINWSSTAGTTVDNTFIVNNSGQLTVNRDINFTSTGGRLIQLQANNTSTITVARDITFSATAAGQEQIQLNNSARLRIGRNFVRGGTPYGALICNGSSVVELFTNTYLQTLGGSAGSGGDSFLYNNLIVNNTRLTTPQVTLGGAVTVNGNLTLTSGVISTTASNILNLTNTTSTTIGSTSSYVDGPMTYEVASSTPNTIRNLPLGDNGSYRPAILSVSHADASTVVYTAEHFMQSAGDLGYTLPGTIDRVSGVRYWNISRSGAATPFTARVTLYYGIGSSDGVTDPTNLRVVKTNGAGTTWFDVGGTGSASGTGTITSNSFSSFSTITLGNAVGGTNPLPVELKYFNASRVAEGVVLDWATASELNNDYFTIQRSTDGSEFANLIDVEGSGTKSDETNYQYIDEMPLMGISYYRLRQTDFDGSQSYSEIIKVKADLSLAGVILTPNPIEKGITPRLIVNGLSPNEPVRVLINDMLSRAMNKFDLITNEHGRINVELDLTNLPSGVYLMTIQNQSGRIGQRLVVR
ncbi:MAG: T9SS type A sorting domain-containing protein, partial [Cyclobacteriaceae bacterium]|nr:T9SS type A sorting domain-containing protein [Cyclobacteriaceae bacterium]